MELFSSGLCRFSWCQGRVGISRNIRDSGEKARDASKVTDLLVYRDLSVSHNKKPKFGILDWINLKLKGINSLTLDHSDYLDAPL